MKIYKKKAAFYMNAWRYIFIKNKNQCLDIVHNLDMDFGEKSTSGAELEV